MFNIQRWPTALILLIATSICAACATPPSRSGASYEDKKAEKLLQRSDRLDGKHRL